MCERGCTESISSPGTQVSISRIWHVRHDLDGSDERSKFLRKICGNFKAIRQHLRVLEGGEWFGREIVDRVTHASRLTWPIRAVQSTIPYTWRRTNDSKRTQTHTRATRMVWLHTTTNPRSNASSVLLRWYSVKSSRPLLWEGWLTLVRVIDVPVYQDVLTWDMLSWAGRQNSGFACSIKVELAFASLQWRWMWITCW